MTSVVGYRVAAWDTPFWVNPNRNASRYSAPGSIVQYWSLHPLTPWAEYLRGQDLREADRAAEVVLTPWAAEITLPDNTIELTFASADGYGVRPNALVDDDWADCQEWVQSNRPDGLIVPSAALPGTRNLILFGPRVRSRYGVPPIDISTDVPCDPVAGQARLIEFLLPHVRWRGHDHDGLNAWCNGEDPPLPPAVRVPMLSS